MSQASTSSSQTRTRRGDSTPSSDRCSASMPGARSTVSSCLSVGWISAMRGSSRWVTNSPSSSTTIQARSYNKPVSVSSASVSEMPAHDLTGYTQSWAMVA